ncbi:MAG: dihydrofolate reductase [Clostridia bacterium]|nr:dihydrofolate reductase [Clostridia bacterium]
MKAIFTYDYGQAKLDAIRALGYEVMVVKESIIENGPEVDDAEILVCYNPFERLDISKMPALKLIILSSMGFDQLPLEEVKHRNILVTNNKGGYSKPIGEWVAMSLLNIYKDTKYFYRRQDDKIWHINTGVWELVGKNILFLGTGSVATEAAKRLQGFEAKVIGMNTDGRAMPYFDECISFDQMMHYVSKVEAVVCALPYNDQMHHLIDERFLGAMKDCAVLINVSRGKLVDEEALVRYLDDGKFMGIALDVFEREPLPKESPLWEFERVYLSPHNSWISEMRNERRFENIFENLKRYSNQAALINLVKL